MLNLLSLERGSRSESFPLVLLGVEGLFPPVPASNTLGAHGDSPAHACSQPFSTQWAGERWREWKVLYTESTALSLPVVHLWLWGKDGRAMGCSLCGQRGRDGWGW